MAVTLGNQSITSSTGNLGIGTDSPGAITDIFGGDLGTTAGNAIEVLRLRNTVNNTDRLRFFERRVTNGTDWTTAAWRIQRQVDSVVMAFMEFNGTQLVFGTGTNNTERLRITSAGQLRTKVTGSSNVLMDSFGCRAWVNFNGTGTVAIRASGNVSSITDEGTGQYRVNFATAMPDANYSAPMSSSENATTTGQGNQEGHGKTTTLTTTSCRVITKFHVFNVSSRAHDSALVSVAIFR